MSNSLEVILKKRAPCRISIYAHAYIVLWSFSMKVDDIEGNLSSKMFLFPEQVELIPTEYPYVYGLFIEFCNLAVFV